MAGKPGTRIGLAANANQYTPVQVTGLSSIRSIATDENRCLAISTSGQVYVWGENDDNSLGLNNGAAYTGTPALLGTFPGVASVALCDGTMMLVRGDGTTLVWGYNNVGQFGTSSPSPTFSAVPVAGPTFSPNVQVQGQTAQFLSIERTGLVKSWGYGGGVPLGYTPVIAGVDGGSCVPTAPTGVCRAVPESSFSICGLLRAYYQNPTATYVASKHGYTVSPAEVGTYGQLTVIDVSQPPYNGSLTFDGIYHVRGNVRFANGNVTLAPGTVFYLDGDNGKIISSIDDSQLVSLEATNGTLTLNGATLQASCNSLWSGIVVSTGGTLVTTAASNGTRSLIRDAQFAVNNGGTLRLDQTDFLDNGTAIFERPQATSAPELVTKCAFRVTQATGTPLATSSRGLYNSYGLVFGGDGSSSSPVGNFANAVYSTNTFDRLRYGIYGLASGALINIGNTFTNCWGAALEGYVSFQPAAGPTAPLRFYDNIVNVPCNFPVAFTTTANRPVYGVHAQNGVDVRGNSFRLLPGTGTISRRIGVSLLYGGTVRESVTNANIVSNFDKFDVGIQANGADWVMPVSYDFSRNDFYGLAEGITFQPPGPYNYGNQSISVTMRCNTFDTSTSPSNATGVWVKPSTVFASALGNNNAPNGNHFDGISTVTKRFVNDAATSAAPFQYFRYNTTQEALAGMTGNQIWGSTTNNPFATSPIPAIPGTNACGVNPPTGVYLRAASPLLSAALLQTQQDTLARFPQASVRQAQLLASVLDHHRYARSFAALENFLRPLATTRPAVYIPGILVLLNAYRQTNHEADAQRVRPMLNALAATDAELLNYLRYWDAVGHLRPDRRMPFGYDLPAADLAALRLSAASGTLAARPACELLQRLDTNCRCVLPEDAAPAAQALAASRSETARTGFLGEAHPNPAQENVVLAYALPVGSAPATLVLRDLTGRRVLALKMESASGTATLAVDGLPSGLYVATLEVNGQRYASRKLAIVR